MFEEVCFYCKCRALYAVWCHDPQVLQGDRGPAWVEVCGNHHLTPTHIVSTMRIPGRKAR